MSETAAAVTPMADHIKQFWRYLERERVRILVDLHRDGYCDSSSFNDEFAKALLAERTAAQQKIAELEAELKDERWQVSTQDQERQKAYQLLTAERQQRESAEAAIVELLSSHDNLYIACFGEKSNPFDDISAKVAREWLNTRYPASDSEERGG